MLGLATCAAARPFDSELALLRAELRDSVVVDLHRRLDDFFRWAAHVDVVSSLRNQLDVIRWNVDKRYLGELANEGIPTVPTTFVTHDVRHAHG